MTGPDNRVNTQVQGLLHHQPSKLDVQSHSRKEQVLREIDNYFGKDWPFEGSEELKKIHDNDLTGMVCYAFPTAHDDRIFILVLFFIVVVLVDDMLDDMSFKEGELFIERLISISRQEKDVNPSIPIEYLISDIWKRIREIDTEAIIPILQETFSVWKHQVVKDRNKWNSFSDYLDYRIHDGAGILAKLMLRFGGGMNLNNYHEEAVHQLDINAARSIGIMNDIYSFEKEIQTSQASGTDIASLCSSVEVVSRECKVKADTAKDILLTICRDWERQHEALSEEIISRSPELSSYCTALGYLISGNEAWSKETFRYKHGLTARQNLD